MTVLSDNPEKLYKTKKIFNTSFNFQGFDSNVFRGFEPLPSWQRKRSKEQMICTTTMAVIVLNPFFLGENFKSGLIGMTQYYSISSDCLKEKFYSQSVSFTSFRAKVSGKEKKHLASFFDESRSKYSKWATICRVHVIFFFLRTKLLNRTTDCV